MGNPYTEVIKLYFFIKKEELIIVIFFVFRVAYFPYHDREGGIISGVILDLVSADLNTGILNRYL